LLRASQDLLSKGLHPTQISDGFQVALNKAVEVIDKMSLPVDLHDRDSLIQNAITSMASKVISNHSDLLAPIAVDSILRVIGDDIDTADNCDLNNIHVAKKIGGTIDESELINGLVFVDKKASHFAGGPTRIENAKIGIV
jgi:T-complex protein 1 subunit delta